MNNLIYKELRARKVFDKMNKFLLRRNDKALSLESAIPIETIERIQSVWNEALLYKIEQGLANELVVHYPQQTKPMSLEDLMGQIYYTGEFFDDHE